jgi:hypothetical protein
MSTPEAGGPAVFICHAAEDRPLAEVICRCLEEAGTRCWMAPRDVEPAQSYGEQVLDAIEAAAAMIVIMSPHVNDSPYVRNEVDRATAKDKDIFLFLTVETRWPCFPILTHRWWIAAWEPPLETRIDALVAAVRQQLGQP